ncbi:hypothetical protein BHM03_00041378 [Ensete ventricosum]|nr:hypothetical protein BHM03_00041378 [Ensete ventricosum]
MLPPSSPIVALAAVAPTTLYSTRLMPLPTSFPYLFLTPASSPTSAVTSLLLPSICEDLLLYRSHTTTSSSPSIIERLKKAKRPPLQRYHMMDLYSETPPIRSYNSCIKGGRRIRGGGESYSLSTMSLPSYL